MNAIDRVGAFRGRIVEHGVGETKNGYPQLVARIVATQRYVEDKGELEALGIGEAGWVDWSSYEMESVGYLVLMFSDKNSGEVKPSFQMEAVQKATGWDGASFQALAQMDLTQKDITFWIGENEYNGNVSLRVDTIDDGNASPNRTLRALDGEGLKNLDSKFAAMLAGKKVAAKVVPASAPVKAVTPPKTAVAPGKPAASMPTAVSAAKPAVSAASSAPASVTAAKTTAPSKGPPTKAVVAAPAPAPAEELDQGAAWNLVIANKGSASDDAVAEAWLKASDEAAPGKDESTMTATEWATIARAAIKLLDV